MADEPKDLPVVEPETGMEPDPEVAAERAKTWPSEDADDEG